MRLDLYILDKVDGSKLFTKNITHNLNIMAGEVNVYWVLWRPKEVDCRAAKDIIDILERGLNKLKDNPSKYKKLNPVNGWGTYEDLVEFVEQTLEACKKYPSGVLYACR